MSATVFAAWAARTCAWSSAICARSASFSLLAAWSLARVSARSLSKASCRAMSSAFEAWASAAPLRAALRASACARTASWLKALPAGTSSG